MSGFMSLLGSGSNLGSNGSYGGSSFDAGGGYTGTMPSGFAPQQPNILQNVMRAGMSGSLNAGFGGKQGNFFQNMLGNNAWGNTLGYGLDLADKQGMLFKPSQPEMPSMPAMSSPLAQIISRYRR